MKMFLTNTYSKEDATKNFNLLPYISYFKKDDYFYFSTRKWINIGWLNYGLTLVICNK